MKLKQIKVSRIKNRVNLSFDDDTFLPMLIDDVVRLHLRPDAEFTSEAFTELSKISLSYLLKDYALNQLALSAKIAPVLRRKLQIKARLLQIKYKFPDLPAKEFIDPILDDLESRNLLSEKNYVETIVHRLSRRPQKYIFRYLQSKGINPKNYPDLFPQSNDREILQKILHTPKYRNLNTSDPKTKRRLIAALIRKGFAYDDIKTLIDYRE